MQTLAEEVRSISWRNGALRNDEIEWLFLPGQRRSQLLGPLAHILQGAHHSDRLHLSEDQMGRHRYERLDRYNNEALELDSDLM